MHLSQSSLIRLIVLYQLRCANFKCYIQGLILSYLMGYTIRKDLLHFLIKLIILIISFIPPKLINFSLRRVLLQSVFSRKQLAPSYSSPQLPPSYSSTQLATYSSPLLSSSYCCQSGCYKQCTMGRRDKGICIEREGAHWTQVGDEWRLEHARQHRVGYSQQQCSVHTKWSNNTTKCSRFDFKYLLAESF